VTLKLLVTASLALSFFVNAANAETLAEMLRRMDRELQEVRALTQEHEVALASVPKGAVVPFRLVECPSGWRLFSKAAGRTIIGAGKGENLTERALGERGGEENHRLTHDELPQVEATDADSEAGGGFHAGVPRTRDKRLEAGTRSIETPGTGKAHSNMQPWIALLYCEKQ